MTFAFTPARTLSPIRTVPPALYPVTLDEARAYLRGRG